MINQALISAEERNMRLGNENWTPPLIGMGFGQNDKAVADFELVYAVYKDEPTRAHPFKCSSKKLFLVPLTEEAAKATQPFDSTELPAKTQEILNSMTMK